MGPVEFNLVADAPRHQACEGSLVGALDSQTKLMTHKLLLSSDYGWCHGE